MRIVTWNCFRGDCLTRADELLPLEPDVIVLQECSRPESPNDSQCIWFGDNPTQGVGIVARNGYSLERGPIKAEVTHSVFPVVVQGPIAFRLLAVWALPKPTYVQAMDAGLMAYKDFVRQSACVIAGDFNSHSRFDFKNRQFSHTMLVQKLRDEFGLVSAFHSRPSLAADLIEEATYYHKRKEEQPFHIDYCFLPQDWAPHIREVSVGNYQDWKDKSDHRPLLVDVELARPPTKLGASSE